MCSHCVAAVGFSLLSLGSVGALFVHVRASFSTIRAALGGRLLGLSERI
jgi:hypothetical protein